MWNRFRPRSWKWCLATFWCTLFSGVAPAELAPEVYAQWQRQAPEYLRIEVLRVSLVRTVYPDFTQVSVTVDARVQAVERSATHVRRGQRIGIQYERREHKSPLPGPGAVPILEAGKVYPAFLEKPAGQLFFRPVAGSWSFDVIRGKARKEM
jgi:hypothetical protein